MQKEEYLIKNACYSVTKYYLCKRNNKRSLSGRKQRLEVVRSFPNRYQFSCINKVTSLFSNRYIFIIILECVMEVVESSYNYSDPRLLNSEGTNSPDLRARSHQSEGMTLSKQEAAYRAEQARSHPSECMTPSRNP